MDSIYPAYWAWAKTRLSDRIVHSATPPDKLFPMQSHHGHASSSRWIDEISLDEHKNIKMCSPPSSRNLPTNLASNMCEGWTWTKFPRSQINFKYAAFFGTRMKPPYLSSRAAPKTRKLGIKPMSLPALPARNKNILRISIDKLTRAT